MGTTLDEKLLEDKLAAIEKARAWSPRVIARLEALVTGGDERAVFRVNPLRFGAERNVAEPEAVDLFLHAARHGIFTMDWHLVCPTCADTVHSFSSLKMVFSRFHCDLCHVDLEVNLDEYIAIDFTVSTQIRRLRFHAPETLSVEEYYYDYSFSREAQAAPGVRITEVYQQLQKALISLVPGEHKAVEFDIPAGELMGGDLFNKTGVYWSVEGKSQAATQRVALTLRPGGFEPGGGKLASGRLVLDVTNATDGRGSLFLVHMPPGTEHKPLAFEPFLSGKRLLTTQTFRDLFRSEVIKGTESLSVKSITILFTDLKGSTALYDRIGDLKAFALVQQHFESLGRIVQRNGGAIVKTIGDAVMATFLDPVSGLKAALEMLEEIESFNQEHGTRELVLKIGLHHGPSLAVTSNDRLDYFGQTVNVASRVQGLADAEEIYLTREVYDYPGVKALLEGHAVASRKAALKGIQSQVEVFRLAPRSAAGAAT